MLISTQQPPDTIVIGNRASATFANSVAIGNDAAATRANQIALGNTTNTYRLAGVTSAVSRDQQGAVTELLTVAEIPLSALYGSNLEFSMQQNAQQIQLALSSIDDNSSAILRNTEEISELNSGLAAVTALPDMYLSPDVKWSAAGGVGIYADDVGIGATLAIRPGNNIALGASVASAGDKASGKLQVGYEGF